jgi:diguanylate cyclase (GGDEF)-like protein
MAGTLDLPLPLRLLLVGLAYYAGAWLGVTQTITPEGIAIIWPPNALLLSAFLLFPYSHWPLLAVAALLAECAADVPAFPLWAALGFAMVNLLECALAAWLIRRTASGRFDFDSLKRGATFLLYGPFLASALAALLGAGVYLLLGRTETGYWALWRLWWFGDALGLLLLTPLIVVLWRWLEQGLPRPSKAALAEAALLWGMLLLVGMSIFPQGEEGTLGFHLTPTLLLPFGAWAAARLGVWGAATTVVLIAVMAIGFMVRGVHPYHEVAPQLAVWLMQEYLAVVAVLSIGLALLLHEIRKQRSELAQRVEERTEALRQSNVALEEANARLNELAGTDYLTGIANRRHFYSLAERELQRQSESESALSLLMLDLDHFKEVNDRYGHDAGDQVLKSVVDTVQTTIRPLDPFGRYGGEEFLVLLPDTPVERAVEIAERIRRRVAALEISYDEQRIEITVSIGVVQWDGTDGLEQLLAQVDCALYDAKLSGRNCVKVGGKAVAEGCA